MIPKSHDLDKWIAKYCVSKVETYRDTELCIFQYLFSIFSVSEFFIGHEEVDLVKAQNTFQVIVVGNQEEVAHPKDAAQEDEAHPKEAVQEEEALPEDAVQEEVVPRKKQLKK